MGMFDDVRCEYPLPLEGANARHYQTKSLGCEMDTYVIRADGSLWSEGRGVWRSSSRVEQRITDYTGEIRFYEYRDKPRRWTEFSAYFIDGQLQSVTLIEDDHTPHPTPEPRP